MKGGDKKDVGASTPAPEVKAAAARKRRAPAAKKDEASVSNALRSVYQRTVEEDVPSEMLDLLRKLD
ncbi:MAG TPA: NepR family anti-sigma factor [Sphingobium sp.]